MEKVQITITGIQHDIDEEPMVETHIAEYGEKEDEKYAVFTENGVRTLLRLSEREVRIIRTPGTTLSFIPGTSCSSVYSTEYGDFDMLVTASDIVSSYDAGVLSFRIEYDLTMNGSHISKCEVTIDIRKD